MYSFEQQVPVLLQFRAMDTPISVVVPLTILRYLDTNSVRTFAEDGAVIYQQMPCFQTLPPTPRWLGGAAA